MSERNPSQQSSSQGRRLRCEEWECLLVDALDGSLAEADTAAFEQHRGECAACARMFEEARQGAEWLEFLAPEPEVPRDLAIKILARTRETVAKSPSAAGVVSLPAFPVWRRTAVPMARRVLDPRRLMTAAMAFFSIALTLHLTGIKPYEVHLSDLRPSAVSATVVRQYYSVKEQGVKYYDNLRFVYEMEARVRELRQSSEPASNQQSIRRTQSPSSRNGNSWLPKPGQSQATAARSLA